MSRGYTPRYAQTAGDLSFAVQFNDETLSLIARTSSKLGKIRTETRSWLPKWQIIGHYCFSMRNIWKTEPDS